MRRETLSHVSDRLSYFAPACILSLAPSCRPLTRYWKRLDFSLLDASSMTKNCAIKILHFESISPTKCLSKTRTFEIARNTDYSIVREGIRNRNEAPRHCACLPDNVRVIPIWWMLVRLRENGSSLLLTELQYSPLNCWELQFSLWALACSRASDDPDGDDRCQLDCDCHASARFNDEKMQMECFEWLVRQSIRQWYHSSTHLSRHRRWPCRTGCQPPYCFLFFSYSFKGLQISNKSLMCL